MKLHVPFTHRSPVTITPTPEAPQPVPVTQAPTREYIIGLAAHVDSVIDSIKKVQEIPMATVPVAVAPKVSFLSHFGHFFRNLLHIGEEVAIIARPIVSVAFPEVAPLFNSAVGLALAAEATAAQAAGTGPQKLAQVVTGINPLIDKFVADNNLGTWDQANRAKFASAIADALNLIPAPKG